MRLEVLGPGFVEATSESASPLPLDKPLEEPGWGRAGELAQTNRKCGRAAEHDRGLPAGRRGWSVEVWEAAQERA